ncbi:hypothetical protein BJV78DRAFT_1153991 [Lactifluus subvellereus]|nr:hypothetical protein BJV78DRAFT_1153991 [Lactifluus subvellereus]
MSRSNKCGKYGLGYGLWFTLRIKTAERLCPLWRRPRNEELGSRCSDSFETSENFSSRGRHAVFFARWRLALRLVTYNGTARNICGTFTATFGAPLDARRETSHTLRGYGLCSYWNSRLFNPRPAAAPARALLEDREHTVKNRLDDDDGFLPYMVTVNTTTPITPLFLSRSRLPLYDKAAFPKYFLETYTLRYPGPWQVALDVTPRSALYTQDEWICPTSITTHVAVPESPSLSGTEPFGFGPPVYYGEAEDKGINSDCCGTSFIDHSVCVYSSESHTCEKNERKGVRSTTRGLPFLMALSAPYIWRLGKRINGRSVQGVDIVYRDVVPTFHSPSVANSSFRRRDHLRLIAFHPLLVRSFGGLARGSYLSRALLAALSRSGMRASADELSAWEALMDSLVGCVRGLVHFPCPS